jgi:uncharacterized protein
MLNFPTSRVEVSELRIPIHGLSSDLCGTTLVQLSDFHFGQGALPMPLLQETVGIVQQIQPDLICYTGDFINGDPGAIASLCHSLQAIHGKFGTVAVLGNHDYFEAGSADTITRFLESINIRVLQDEVCYPLGPGLAIVGFQSFFAHNELVTLDPDRVLAKIPRGVPTIALTHCPRYSELLGGRTIDLHLAGHTHGGQLAFPGVGPLLPKFWEWFNLLPHWLQSRLLTILPPPMMHNQDCQYIRGLYLRHQGYLYVNRGLGTHFPGRLFCRPEITVITLVAADLEAHTQRDSVGALVRAEIST